MAEQTRPWSNVYGVGRTLLSLSTLSTLLLQSPDDLFRPFGRRLSMVDTADQFKHINLFVLLGGDNLNVARWIAIGVLALVAIGWRPRITGILHWWVALSFVASTSVIEGGDQIAASLALFMIPLTLTDSRRWHWQHDARDMSRTSAQIAAIVAGSCLTVMRLQMAVVYLDAAIGKMGVPEWMNGTAMYYWALHPDFGVPMALRGITIAMLSNVYVVTTLTWGVMLLELALFTGLVIEKRFRSPLLVSGILFHFGIVVVHGLASFFLVMAGGLVIYLRPAECEFRMPEWVRRIVSSAGTTRAGTRRRGVFPAAALPTEL